MTDWLCHECKKKPGTDVPHRPWCSTQPKTEDLKQARRSSSSSPSVTGDTP